MGGFFHLENGDDEIAKSHRKKVGGPRDRKKGLGKFNIIFFSIRKHFANITLFHFSYREIKKARPFQNLTLFP